MATQPTTTRRALFAAAPAIALAAAAAESPLIAQWRAAHQLEIDINANRFADDNAAVSRMCAMEDRIITAPIGSRDDALAVLMAIGLSVVRGDRTDEEDERAYNRVVAWMEAN